MTRFLYPRLSAGEAERVMNEIMITYRKSGADGVRALAKSSHPNAAPVPTGGLVADVDQIGRVREAVIQAMEPWLAPRAKSMQSVSSFDIALGRSLHASLKIVPSDAAHETTWNFLSLVVMPDVVVARLTDLRPELLLGKHRNPLRAAWMRRDTLGDLLDRSSGALRVDEMVGLFERNEMARNRPLIRALALEVMDYDGGQARSFWARTLFKEVRYATGPLMLDGMTEDELRGLIREIVDARGLN